MLHSMPMVLTVPTSPDAWLMCCGATEPMMTTVFGALNRAMLSPLRQRIRYSCHRADPASRKVPSPRLTAPTPAPIRAMRSAPCLSAMTPAMAVNASWASGSANSTKPASRAL